MTPSVEMKLPATRRHRREALLAGSALCGAVMLMALPTQAQTLPGIPTNITVNAGGALPVITAPNANTLDVALNAPRTVINWDSFHVSGSDAVNFHFVAGNDIVLNKSPTQVMVDNKGQVKGDVGGVTGGNIWFYSPAGVLISPGAVMTAGNFVFSRGTAIDDMLFVADANPLAFLRAASDALIVTDTIGKATQASIDPVTGDVVLSSATDDIKATAAVSVGKVTITATVGLVDVGEVTAKGGAATVTAGTSASVTTGSASNDIVLTGGTSASLTAGTAGQDIKITGPAATLGAGDATRDILITGGAGGVHVGVHAIAGGKIDITAASDIDTTPASLTSAGLHVSSTAGSATVGTAKATAGDITVDATATATLADGTASGAISVTGASAVLHTGNAGGDITVSGATATLDSGDAGGDILVTATNGAATINNHATAGDDVEVKATGGNVDAASATLTSKGAGADDGHVLAQSTDKAVNLGAGVTQGAGAKAGDVTVDGHTGVNVGSIATASDSSHDFIATSATGAVSVDSAKAKNNLTVTAATSASVTTGAAGNDITVTGKTASLTSGDTDTGDILVTATAGAATIGDHATAGDDVEVKATGGNVEAASATLTSKGAGADDGHVLAQSTDKSVNLGAGVTQGSGAKAGDVTADGHTGATVGTGSDSSQDVIVTTATGTASLGSGHAKRDIKVTGPAASLTSGDTDTGDILVTASAGVATIGDHATAGDDVEVKATGGNVEAGNATLTSKGAGADDGHVLAQSTDKSVNLGAGVTLGTGAKAGDVTVDGHTGAKVGSGSDSSQDFIATPPTGDVTLGAVHAHRDVIVSPAAGSVLGGGDVSADRDIAISTLTGDINIGSASAGDDVVMRAPVGTINATGDIKAGRDHGSATAADADGAGDALNAAHPFLDFDAAPTTIFSTVGYDVNLAAQAIHVTGSTVAGHQPSTDALGTGGPVDTTTSDVRIQTLVGPTPTAGLDPSLSLGAVIATRDIQIDSYRAVTTGGLSAGRDIAVLGRGGAIPGGAPGNGGDVQIGSAHAGDDVVIYSIFGHAHVLGDVTSGLTFAEFQPNTDVSIDGATQAADQLAIYLHYFDLDKTSKPGKPTSAILIRGETVTVGGAMQAVGSGSDISLRSAGNLTVSGDAHAGANATFTTDAAGGATLSLNTVTAEGSVSVDGGAPGTGNFVSANGLHANGGDVGVRGHQVNLGTTTASGDVVVTGDTVTMGGTSAGGDVAVSGGSVTLGTTSAGDDVVVRAADITLHGNVTAGGGADSNNAGDALVASGGAVSLEGVTFDVAGRHDVDIKATNTVTADAGTLKGDNVRVQAPGAISINNADAVRDVLVDGQAQVTTGNLSAGRDVGVRSTGDGFDVAVSSASAGDDVVIRGRQNITTGGLTAHGQDSTATDQAGDLMFNADKSHLGASPVGDFAITGGQNVDVRSTNGSVQVGGANADTEVRIQTAEITGGSVRVGLVQAGENVLLDGKGVTATAKVAATNHDVAVRGREGSDVSLADASAGDDVVIRTGGNVVTGSVNASGGVADGGGFGGRLLALDTPVTLEGHAYDLTGHNVDIKAGSVVTGGLTADNDVRVQAPGAIDVGGANAGRDVLIDGQSAVTTGGLNAGRDVGVRSTGEGFDVRVGDATAGDDVVIRGTHDITTGALTAQGADSSAPDQAGDLMYDVARTKLNGDLSLAGQNVDVRSTKGAIRVTGPVVADTGVRLQTEEVTGGSVSVVSDGIHGPATVTAGENVLLDGKGVTASDKITATNHDVAVRGREGSEVNLVDASAGDDVVIRTGGNVTAGNLAAGGGVADGGGFGERLLAVAGPIVLEGHAYDLTGHNVDIKSGGAGTGALSATNDVRVQAGGVNVASANAGRDVMIDAGQQVTTGGLQAGRDVGVRSTGDGFDVAVGSASAGDDVVIRASGNIGTGALAAHGADSTASDQAGDLMFGASTTKLNGDLSLAGQNVDVRSTKGAIAIGGSATADTDARFQTEQVTGGSVTVADVTGGQNVLLDGKGVTAIGKLTATSHDVAVRGHDGADVNLNTDVSAGDDVVIRTSGNVTTAGASATGGVDGGGLGERLVAAEGAIALEGHTYDLTGHNVDIKAGGAGTGALSAANDVRVQAGGVTVASANAGRDVLIDGSQAVTTGGLSAGRDVGVRSTGDGFDVAVADVTAGDDVVIRGKHDIMTGKLTAHGADSSATDQAGDLMFGADKTKLSGDLTLAGQNVDVRSTKGSIVAGGSVTADGDARLQTEKGTGGTVTVADVTGGQNILLDGKGVTATGKLTATSHDVAVRGHDGSNVSLNADVSAGDDVVIRTSGNVTTASVNAGVGAGADSGGLGGGLAAAEGAIVLEGHAYDLTGHNVDIKAAGLGTGALGATNDIRVQASGGVDVATANAGRDVLIDGGGSVTTGDLGAGRDVAVRSTYDGTDSESGTGAIVVRDVTAKDDVVIRGKRNITTGKLTAQGADSTATDQAGDLMFGGDKTKLNGDLTLAGQNVDVRSTKGAITVGTTKADTDARFQTAALTGGAVKVTDVTAGQNVLLDGSTVEATGALTATNADVAVRARGGAAKLLDVTAGDDVAIRATGEATAGLVTTGGKPNSDGLADKLVLDAGRLTVEGRAFDVAGSDIDVVSGTATIDTAHAAGSIRMKTTGGLAKLTTSGKADGGEILIDSAGSVSATDLTASGDIALRATGGDVEVTKATAGDDVVLRANGSINAGTLTANGSNSDGAGDLLFNANAITLGASLTLGGSNIDVKATGSATVGTATAAADIRLQASGDARLTGIGTAARDLLIDGASATGGELHAGGDLALYGRAGSVTLGSATAGDDIAIRASAGVGVTGALTTTGVGDAPGLADRLISVAGGLTVAGAVFDLTGAAIDVRGADISVGGAIKAAGASGNVRLQSAGALTLADASATADVLLDAAGQVTTQSLSAGRDIGVRSTGGALTIASASAGDDVVLRASKAITVNGALTARGETDAAGAGDLLFNADATDLGGALDLTGSNVDVRSSGGSILAQGAINAAADVRLQTTGAGDVTTGDIVAGRDVLLDGATATAGAVKGGRDIAARARAGAVTLGSADAGDDLVLRATGDIKVAGTASAKGGADGVGVGDRLFNTDRTKLNGDFDLAGSNVDAKSSGGAIGFSGQVSAGRDVRLQTTGGGAISTAGVETATGDIFADASSVSATGALKAGGDVALRSRTGTVEVASISAGDDIAVRSAGAFTAHGALSSGSGANVSGAADRLISTSESGMIVRQKDPASAAAAEGFNLAGGDIDIRSGGAISTGALNAAGKSTIALQSPGDIALGAVTGDSIFARAASLQIGGVWTATTARIESTAAGGVALGTDLAGAMKLTSDQINQINAATLQIFAGDTSGAMRGTALQIGTLSIDVAKVKTALQLYAGSGVEVRITGLFAPSTTAANSTVVSIGANAIAGNWTPKSIKVIADNGGAIGFSTTRDGRAFDGVRAFGGVELNATNDILIGFQDFIDKLAATNAADVSNVAKTFHAAQGPDGSRILITAGALSLRADGKVAQQDTSPIGGLTRTGIFLTGNPTAGAAELSIDSMTKSTLGTIVMPQYVELYGALKTATTVLANESTALSNSIVLVVKPSQFYRLNTCVIFQTGTCSPAGGPPNTNIAPDRLTALNILDRTDAAGAADPTVASATNEEIWKSPE